LDRPEAARYFIHAYQVEVGERLPPALVHFYWAYRAYIRSMVASFRSAQGDSDAPQRARRLHAIALDHLREAQVRLVLVGGLPGSGKTTLTSELGSATGWKLLHSDDVRRALRGPRESGVPDPPAYLSGPYEPSVTRSVYEELLRQAESALALGESVILDASWTDASWRLAAASVAERTSSDLTELCLRCDPEVADARILKRLADGADSSGATPAVRRAMSVAMDPWPSAEDIETTHLPAKESARRLVSAATVGKGPVDA
jgi:predicted kinase